MTILPILLDACPPYLEGTPEPLSVLTVPLSSGLLVDRFVAHLSALTTTKPVVHPTCPVDSGYVDAIRAGGSRVDVILDLDGLRARIEDLEPADLLLLIDARMFPLGGFSPMMLRAMGGEEAVTARHLLALEGSTGHTKEYVQSDRRGRLRKIQRYYHPVTWPFASGIVGSLVPVSCTLMAPDIPLCSLPDLRRALATVGVPARDVPLEDGAFDLTDERGLLFLSQRLMRNPGGARPQDGALPPDEVPELRDGCDVHPSARLLGSVIVSRGAVVERDAVIIGPTVIGNGARVGAGAVVAQSLVLPRTSIEPQTTVRHSVFTGAAQAARSPVARSRRHDSGAFGAFRPDTSERPVRTTYPRLKRLFDVTVAAAVMLVLSPFFLAMTLLVKLGSRGPGLYGGEREGRDGKPFKCWKFRSMFVGADAKQRELAASNHVDGPQFKMRDDPRVTPIGRWLRRVNLDELPQLINVLKGEMSLVGPRPSPFRENQVCVPWRQARLSVPPGITGLWQVCRHDRERGDFHQWIHYDLLYVQHASLWVDLKILCATVWSLGGRWPVRVSTIVPGALDDLDPPVDRRAITVAADPVRTRSSRKVGAL